MLNYKSLESGISTMKERVLILTSLALVSGSLVGYCNGSTTPQVNSTNVMVTTQDSAMSSAPNVSQTTKSNMYMSTQHVTTDDTTMMKNSTPIMPTTTSNSTSLMTSVLPSTQMANFTTKLSTTGIYTTATTTPTTTTPATTTPTTTTPATTTPIPPSTTTTKTTTPPTTTTMRITTKPTKAQPRLTTKPFPTQKAQPAPQTSKFGTQGMTAFAITLSIAIILALILCVVLFRHYHEKQSYVLEKDAEQPRLGNPEAMLSMPMSHTFGPDVHTVDLEEHGKDNGLSPSLGGGLSTFSAPRSTDDIPNDELPNDELPNDELPNDDLSKEVDETRTSDPPPETAEMSRDTSSMNRSVNDSNSETEDKTGNDDEEITLQPPSDSENDEETEI